MSKGSKRRPAAISSTEYGERYERCFPSNADKPRGQKVRDWYPEHTSHSFTHIAATSDERFAKNHERIFPEAPHD